MVKFLISLFLTAIFVLPRTASAAVIAKQTDQYSNTLSVWQMIQELGDNLSGTASTFTFRINTSQYGVIQFDYTAQNSKIYDKTNNTYMAGCVPPGSDPNDQRRGLTFSNIGVPPGYLDVTIDFSCRNYSFIPGHKYLIFITNANWSPFGLGIFFASIAYGNTNDDYFTGGGLRYANDNPWDYYHNGGSCDPMAYIWNDPTPLPRNGCKIWTTPRDDLYFILKDTAPEPPPSKTPLILIPGIGGSELKVNAMTIWNKDDGHGGTYNHAYGQDEVVWLNESEAIFLGDDDYFDVLRMQANGITSEASVGLTGKLVSRAYGETINFFTDNGYTLDKDFFILPYDWRKDLSLSKDLLDQKIQDIKQQTGSQKVDIVAHSMGGLVARNYIADPPKALNVRKLFTLGTPHLGAVDAIKKLRYGDCLTPLPVSIGPACLGIIDSETHDVIQNMISGYELAPSQTYFDFYNGQDNQHPYPYRTESGALNYSQIKNFLTSLGHNTPLFTPSEDFHSLDSSLSNTNGVDVTNIVGSGQPTLGQIIEAKTTSLLGIQSIHREMININGDETVPLLSASFNFPSTFYTNQKHGSLVANGSALNLVKNILNGDRQLPSEVSNQPYPFNGTGLSVHSPVNIHVYDSSGNHTGPLPNGDFEVNIPGSSYDTLGDAKFIFLPDGGQYTIRFEATDNGSFDFKVRRYENDSNTQTYFYNDVPINSANTGQTILDTNSTEAPTLQIDEQSINASATLTGNESYDQTPPVTSIQLSGTQGLNSWFKSDVTITLNAGDESGIEKIEYTLDNGQTVQTYTNPFTISQEGVLKLKFKATDKAGNEENPQEVEIKIDKTPPEALVQFNLNTQNLEINGQEINPGEVILTDEAGNATKLQVEPKEKKRKEKLEIKTISYNDGPVINLPDNKFEVKFKGRDLDQTIKIKGEEKLKAKYNPKKNITRIEIKEQGEKKRIEERGGIVLLQLLTNKGQLSTNF